MSVQVYVMGLCMCIFSPFYFLLGLIHHPDSLEEVTTLVHRLEAHTSYAYGGYLAGTEASHFLRNESCTQ
jgi:hypothetical protein